MPRTLRATRATGVAALLLAVGASPAVAQEPAPPPLSQTDLSSSSGVATAGDASCTTDTGFATYWASGTAANGAYVGPYRENAAAQLGPGGLSDALELRSVRAAGHFFSIDSPQGKVFGSHQAVAQDESAFCAKPFGDETSLYLSSFPNTRYAARIETPEGAVYVDRGEGFVQVDVFEALDGGLTAFTQTSFDSSDLDAPQLLRRADCRRGGAFDLAYSSPRRCRAAADANPGG